MKNTPMLTTIDNPFNPFTQYDEWRQYDQQKNHYTSELLARFAKTSDELSDELNNEALDQAIEEILTLFAPLGIYKKVYNDGAPIGEEKLDRGGVR